MYKVKLTDLVIIFIIFTIPFQMIQDIKERNLQLIIYENTKMNRILDTAIEDATSALVDQISSDSWVLNKEKAVETFFNTLYINLNIINDPVKQQQIQSYIPFILVMDTDGYYTYTLETYRGIDGLTYFQQVWSEKQYFVHGDERYVYGFTLTNKVTLYVKDSKQFFEGDKDELAMIYPDSILGDSDFDQIRRQCITDTLVSTMKNAINRHNNIAHQMGIFYDFYLPSDDGSAYLNAFNDVGMISFFQGMPIGHTGAYYNHYAFGGAQIIKKSPLYVQKETDGEILYYHREGCPGLVQKDNYFTDSKECAKKGAFPCNICKP